MKIKNLLHIINPPQKLTDLNLKQQWLDRAYFEKIHALNFEFKEGGQEIWDQKSRINQNKFGKNILNFAELWVKSYQYEIANGADPEKLMAKTGLHAQDYLGNPHNEFEVFYAMELLFHTWKHGGLVMNKYAAENPSLVLDPDDYLQNDSSWLTRLESSMNKIKEAQEAYKILHRNLS